ESLSDEEIFEATRKEAVEGGYYLVDWRGHEGYEPGENVVHIFSMGALGSEALAASDRLLEEGVYANVIVVTSGDLLCGNLAHENGYRHLRETLGITGDLSWPASRRMVPLALRSGTRATSSSLQDAGLRWWRSSTASLAFWTT